MIHKLVHERRKKTNTCNSKKKLLEALQDLLKQQRLEQESLKRDKRARGGLAKGLKEMGGLAKAITAGITTGLNYRNAIDKPFYSVEKKEIPNVKDTIISIRKSLANGGSASDEDIGQTLYLIEILENASGLRPDEAMLLEGLYEDLKRMGGSK